MRSNLLLIAAWVAIALTACGKKEDNKPAAVLGCMNPTSPNYNPLATVDDGSCLPAIRGCMDPTALNYNPRATIDDGSCRPVVRGCMDPSSLNYNPNANTDDGSCRYLADAWTGQYQYTDTLYQGTFPPYPTTYSTGVMTITKESGSVIKIINFPVVSPISFNLAGTTPQALNFSYPTSIRLVNNKIIYTGYNSRTYYHHGAAVKIP